MAPQKRVLRSNSTKPVDERPKLINDIRRHNSREAKKRKLLASNGKGPADETSKVGRPTKEGKNKNIVGNMTH